MAKIKIVMEYSANIPFFPGVSINQPVFQNSFVVKVKKMTQQQI